MFPVSSLPVFNGFVTVNAQFDVKNAAEYPAYLEEVAECPDTPMAPWKVGSFVQMFDPTVRAVRYERQFEKYSPYLLGMVYVNSVECVIFDGPPAKFSVFAGDKIFSKTISSGEKLNLPPLKWKYQIEGVGQIDTGMDMPKYFIQSRPNTRAIVVDLINPKFSENWTETFDITNLGFIEDPDMLR